MVIKREREDKGDEEGEREKYTYLQASLTKIFWRRGKEIKKEKEVKLLSNVYELCIYSGKLNNLCLWNNFK